jgi:hypothetical protein
MLVWLTREIEGVIDWEICYSHLDYGVVVDEEGVDLEGVLVCCNVIYAVCRWRKT